MAMGRLPEDGDDETQAVFSDINITPLTDIFLVLLIIFMVGASMAVDAAGGDTTGGERGAMKVDLPKGSDKDVTPAGDDVVVVILADGRVVLGGAEVEDERLADRFRASLAQASSATLIVQADEGASHGRVVEVMEKAREAGFTRLAVATRGK